ncbi:MAG TPA: molybdopterin molybdotransferase MoeA [Dehalococcoidia bacterium]|nr:molybdopterin molybdotransferase MoeA [Dehalococcoidia bacterium]
MLSVEQAMERILGYVNVMESEERSIMESLGQVIAEDVYSGVDVPPQDNAVMDGYAVYSKDTRSASGESPRVLDVIGMVAAGARAYCRLMPGTAVRIMTGAPIPEGADSVVRFEDTDEACRGEGDKKIGILKEVEPGKFIRRAGEDIKKGSKALVKGKVVRPSEVGVLASMGYDRVKGIRRPRVTILATGDELVEVGNPLPPGKIYNSNSYGIAASVLSYGGIPEVLGIARDNEASMLERLRQRMDTDIMVTSAGVSAGDYDIVKDILAKKGDIVFSKVRMKPGKPLAFGTIESIDRNGVARKVPHIGLPGNPVSCMVTAELFLRPAILKMLGRKNLARPTVEAVMEDTKDNYGGTRVFNRAIVTKRDGRYYARLTGPQATGILTSMSKANGLAVIPEDKVKVNKGDVLRVMMLDWDDELLQGD